jgi:cell division protein FtsI (penicillin-binding protein 3)
MNPRDRNRLRAIAILGLVAFGVLLGRLVAIQLVGHDHYAREARAQQTRRVILEPERGRIFDRHLRPMAENVDLSQLSVRPGEIQNAAAVGDFIRETAGAKGMARFRHGRSRHRAYVRVAAQLKPEQELALKTSQLPEGIHIDPVPGRVYPLDDAGRSIVGVVGNEGHGLEGLEQVYDRELQGSSGWATLYSNGRGTNYELPRSMVKLPEAGGSLVTTLDLDAQSVAVMKLREAVARTGAKSGTAVFVDPKTGDIFAMATVDAPGTAGDEHRNRVVADQYEPGSTFKILAGCAAIEENVFTDKDSIWVYQGKVDLGGFTIHDSHPETGWYTLARATSHSSNVAYSQVGTRVGPERLYRYARLFGFGQPTRVQLPGEAPGVIREPARWSKRSLATISIGHEVLVTPLQVVMAYAAVANGGMLMRPRVASAIVDENGEPIREIPVEPVRRVISEATARKFRSFLREAVTEGTASEAALPWCEVAGKTGTAQKTIEGAHGYGVGRYIASFVGMVPADDPKIVGLVILDEPRGAYYGGEVAAPVFRDIVAAWAVQGRGPLSMPTSELVSGGEPSTSAASRVPDVRLLAPGRARELLGREGFDVRVTGDGARVLAQDPPPGEPAARGATVSLTLASATETDEVVMPDLRGLSVRDAITQLRALAIPVERVRGASGRVVDQSPEPGRAVRRETRAVLTLDPRGA